jgi:phage RecT family recombinase
MSTNVSTKVSIVQKLETTPVVQIANLPEVADRFKQLYAIMNGKDSAKADVAYESEKFHFMKLLSDKPDLQKCTKLSLYGCFLDMAVQGLSFDPAMKHAYVVGFPTNVGTQQNPKWETRATLLIDGRGELVIRQRQGQIKYADNPIVVFEGDVFKYGTKNDRVYVEHEAAFPRKSDNILACYLRIERPDGSVDYKVFGIEDVMKLKEFSKQKNSLAWTAGLRGMVETKTIKHAFKSYPKVKMGNFSKLHSEIVDPVEEEFKIDYGIDTSEAALPQANGTFTPVMVVEPATQQATINEDEFAAPAQKQTTTVTHDDDEF